MLANKGPTAGAVLDLIRQLPEGELDKLMRELEGVPDLAGCVVIPETALDASQKVTTDLAGAVRELLAVLRRQATKYRGYTLGPARQKARRQQRHLRIREALENGITDPAQILRFVLDIDPETVTKRGGADPGGHHDVELSPSPAA